MEAGAAGGEPPAAEPGGPAVIEEAPRATNDDEPQQPRAPERQGTSSSLKDSESNGACDAAGAGDAGGAVAQGEEPAIRSAGYREVAREFFVLGWTAFGGPAAHIGMFKQRFVEKLRWVTINVFTELLMLSQCLPGPSSTQMGFSLGIFKKGLAGGMLSGVLFQGPGLLMLSLLGWAAAEVLDSPPAWLLGAVAGLAAAGIALVASAARSLVSSICKGRLLQVLCTMAAVIAYYYPKPWTFPSLIVAGGLITTVANWHVTVKVEERNVEGIEKLGFNKTLGLLLILCWIGILVGALVGSANTDYGSHKYLHWFATFFRTGSVIFGGGQVVLPMLYNDVVSSSCAYVAGGGQDCKDAPDSWMSTSEFYTGLALAQAMPGPLFNFAAYLGAVMALNAGANVIGGIAVCWIGLFGPGLMLIFGILPWWGTFRKWQVYRRALPGLNATAVGLIVTSVFQLTLNAYTTSPFPHASICVGILAYGATDVLRVPAPFVVIGGGVLGLIAHYTGMN